MATMPDAGSVQTHSDLPLALADCDRAISSQLKNADILDSRGFVLFRLNRLGEAMARFRRGLEN